MRCPPPREDVRVAFHGVASTAIATEPNRSVERVLANRVAAAARASAMRSSRARLGVAAGVEQRQAEQVVQLRRCAAASPRRVAAADVGGDLGERRLRELGLDGQRIEAAGPAKIVLRSVATSARRMPAPRSGRQPRGREGERARRAVPTMPAGIATRPGSDDARSSDSAIPAMTNAGTPTAGIVHTQSPPVCTAKYAAVPSAPVAASELRARRPMPRAARAPGPDDQQEARELRSRRARRARANAREGESRGSRRGRGTRSPSHTRRCRRADGARTRPTLRARSRNGSSRARRSGSMTDASCRCFLNSSQRSCVARTGWSTDDEEADNAGEQRRAHEAEHDPAGPGARRGRNAEPPVDEGVREAGEHADACEDEGDRARVAYRVVERLPLRAKRLGQRSRRQGAEHGHDGCRHEQPQALRRIRRRRRSRTGRAPHRRPCSASRATGRAIAVAPPSASARIAAWTSCRAASETPARTPRAPCAAWPFQYVTGKSRRPSKYRSSGSPCSRSQTAVQTARAPRPSTTTTVAARRSAAARSVTSGVSEADGVEERQQAVVARQRREGRPGRRQRRPQREADEQRRGHERQSCRGARQSPRSSTTASTSAASTAYASQSRRRGSSRPCPRRPRTRRPRGRRRERRAAARRAPCAGARQVPAPTL